MLGPCASSVSEIPLYWISTRAANVLVVLNLMCGVTYVGPHERAGIRGEDGARGARILRIRGKQEKIHDSNKSY
jgi:hypothetical protein